MLRLVLEEAAPEVGADRRNRDLRNRGREQQRITRMAGVRRELAEAIGQGIGVITELHDPEGHARCG